MSRANCILPIEAGLNAGFLPLPHEVSYYASLTVESAMDAVEASPDSMDEIVDRADSLFALAHQIEARLTAAQRQVQLNE